LDRGDASFSSMSADIERARADELFELRVALRRAILSHPAIVGRALVVACALLAAGVTPAQLSAATYAEYQPRSDNHDDASRAGNRRIEIVIVPDLSSLPGTEEIERAIEGG
jgi:hypothetical protein